jgi:hypothetical protein
MKVSEPVGQSVDIFIVSISNGQEVNFRQQIEAVDGLLEIDLTLFPDGFFSAYGGPYTLQFFDVESKELINFVATNGNSYNCIEFEFQNGSEVDSITISA